jgi:hypothetical protein
LPAGGSQYNGDCILGQTTAYMQNRCILLLTLLNPIEIMDIKIDNLTQAQCRMLDIIWNCVTQDDFLSWYENLDNQDQTQADTLMRLLAYETIELNIKNFNSAKQVLKQFQL